MPTSMPPMLHTPTMKAPDIVEAWLWNDPGEIIEPLMRRTDRLERRARGDAEPLPIVNETLSAPNAVVVRDRYYTQARRLHVKHLMRGKR